MAQVTTCSVDPNSSPAVTIDSLVTTFKPLYISLIVTCIWSAMLVPLLVVLLFFSNKELRRKPVFIANVFAICVGFALAGLAIASFMSTLLYPLRSPSIPLFVTFVTFMASSPFLVESVLLIRVWAVYPFRTTPRLAFFTIFTVIALLKIARISNVIIFVVNLTRQVNDGGENMVFFQQSWTQFPNYKIEWFLQVADNTITSGLFLFKLNNGRGLKTRMTGTRWGSALEAMFWTALSNFVIPVILSTVELIMIWLSTGIFDIIPVFLVNLYIEIIGVLLATVWSAGMSWQASRQSSNPQRMFTATHIETGLLTSRNSLRQKNDVI